MAKPERPNVHVVHGKVLPDGTHVPDPDESLRDTIRKECFDLCEGCRLGHPLDFTTGEHTKQGKTIKCMAMKQRNELVSLGGHGITEVA